MDVHVENIFCFLKKKSLHFFGKSTAVGPIFYRIWRILLIIREYECVIISLVVTFMHLYIDLRFDVNFLHS